MNDTDIHWSMPRGEARFERSTRRWWRTGLDRTMLIEGEGDIDVLPSLESEPVILHFSESLVLAGGSFVSLWIAWPVSWEARLGAIVVDRFRPPMRKSLLGPVQGGRVLAAAVCPTLREDEAPPEGTARLHLRVRHVAPERATLRRIAFDEAGLTLARAGGRLEAGTVEVNIRSDVDAESTCTPLVLDPAHEAGSETLRQGQAAARQNDPGRLTWWMDGTRRSMGFSL